jgi:hypothetical protein
MGCLVYAAQTLWYLGYPEQALRRSHEALTLMQELSHSFSLAHALIVAIHIRVRRREWQAVQEHAEASIALSTEQGFAQWLALGICFRGLALVEQGHEEGIALMRQGITARRSTGALVRLTHLILFVEALKMVGQNDEGLNLLAEVLPLMDTMEERCYEAELHRLKGELLLAQAPDNHPAAEACFQHALDIAQGQGESLGTPCRD